MGLILFFILIIGIFFYFSTRFINFVRLFSYRIVFALYDVQFDKRRPTAGYFKLHRLLYFARAVGLPTSAVVTGLEWGMISVASSMQPPAIR